MKTQPGSFRLALGLAWAAAFGGGCSLLLHVDADQCSSTADCTARGGAFAGRVCVGGTCVLPEAASGDDALGLFEAGNDAADATTVETGGNDAMMPPEAALEAAAEAQAEAQAEAAVDAGGPSCNSTADCAQVSGTSVACNVDTHTCVQLITTECPYAIGEIAAEGTGLASLFIGAFATIPTNGPTGHPSYLNYDLVQADFAGSGGVPAGTGSGSRVPVIVVCNDKADVNVALNHLVNEVGVRAVVAALPSATLYQAFSTVNLSGDASAPSVFFINPFGADSHLTSLTTDYLLWHMLGQPSDVASAYAAFLPRIEAYLRSTTSLGSTAPMKLATVTSTSTDTLDLASAAEQVLSWNGGQSLAQAQLSDCDGGTNYCAVQLPESTLDGYTLADINVTDAVNQLIAFHPDVVVSFACDEFTTLVNTLETKTASNPTPPKPFYLLGPYNVGSGYVLQWIPANVGPSSPGGDTMRERIAGINFAATPNNQVLATYDTHFISVFGSGASSMLGGENYYDAMYFAVYSLVAAGRPATLHGTDIGAGMAELINPLSQTTCSVGPTDIGNVISDLHSEGRTGISLVGTLGPPDFNLVTGARISEGDVYCIQRDPLEAGAPDSAVNRNPPYFTYDVLRLAADGGVDGGVGLEGTFPCYSGM